MAQHYLIPDTVWTIKPAFIVPLVAIIISSSLMLLPFTGVQSMWKGRGLFYLGSAN